MAAIETPSFAVQVKQTVELTTPELASIRELASYSFGDDFPGDVEDRTKPSEVLAQVVTGNLAASVPRVGGLSLREGQTIDHRYSVLISTQADNSAPEGISTNPPNGETTLPSGHGLIALASFSVNASSRLPGQFGVRSRNSKMEDPNRSFIAAGLYIAMPHFKEADYVTSTPATPFAAALVALHASGVYGDGSRRLAFYPYKGHGGEEWALTADAVDLGATPTDNPSLKTLKTDYINFQQQRYEKPTLTNAAAIILSRHNARELLAGIFGIQNLTNR
jgi:hypothetical protein